MAKFKKVKAGREYTFQPVMIDIIDPKTKLKAGDKVRLVKLRGCPPANASFHCYVKQNNGEVAGLVHCNSLQ